MFAAAIPEISYAWASWLSIKFWFKEKCARIEHAFGDQEVPVR
jgi:hypothetical protein